ncbi:ZDHHC14 [Symbiodinium sp. CCMP2592]|nr:ZDHHC14 [Symbiodinium sp. CCMP2592]
MDASWTTFMSMTGPSSASASSSSGQMAQESEKKPVKVSRMRTPLSSKATPFRSKTAGYCATMKAGFADSMIYPYSPELQDYARILEWVQSKESTLGLAGGNMRSPRWSELEAWPSARTLPEPVPALALEHVGELSDRNMEPMEPIQPLQGIRRDSFEAPCLMRRQLPLHVKRTFIHYDDHELELAQTDGGGPKRTRRPQRSESAPARLLSRQAGQIIQAHINGTCKPCGYFFAKADGCRWHNNCTFCHLCPPGELKRRKKQKRAMLKARNGAQAQNSRLLVKN